jgi:hypothetical protein
MPTSVTRASNFTFVLFLFGRARLRPSRARRLGRSLALPKTRPSGVLLDALNHLPSAFPALRREIGSALILAARMKSFSERPLMAWVQTSTVTLR